MSNDILTRIEKDHDKHRGLLGAIGETEGDTAERRRLYDLLKQEVKAHAAAEEQTLYAKLLKQPDAQEQGRHSIVEHSDAEKLIDALDQIDMADGAWMRKFKELRHELEHHMKEEEQDVFPLADDAMSDQEASQMKDRFEKRKDEECEKAS